ncbi:hypothetical protein JTB14_012652 [Gonioctena quinquepunctata]|nr:hypothetical protein JTB14_012652 [Gonioctena quinquepunctata]
MAAIFILCFISFIDYTFAQRSPTITYITPTVIEDIGGRVELSCSIQYVDNSQVIWMKLDEIQNSNGLPISSGSSLILYDPRYNLKYDPVSIHFAPILSDISNF